MKNSLFLLLIFVISACQSTDSSRRVHDKLHREVNFLHERHVETIDAYSLSLQEASADISKIYNALEMAERERMSELNQHQQSAREKWVQDVVSQFDKRVFEDITRTFDKTIEDVFWPQIVKKQNEFRDKADAIKSQLVSHQCSKPSSGCSEMGFDNYRTLAEQYRQYSLVSEHIIHLGYKQETVIWQRLTEYTHQFRNELKAKAQQVSLPSGYRKSESLLSKDDISEMRDKLDSDIKQLQMERNAITEHWAVTKQALVLLQADINKPEVWELILEGVSERTKQEVASYTTSLNQTLSGVLGMPVGNIVTAGLNDTANQLIGESINAMKSVLDDLFTNTEHQVEREITNFLNSSS